MPLLARGRVIKQMPTKTYAKQLNRLPLRHRHYQAVGVHSLALTCHLHLFLVAVRDPSQAVKRGLHCQQAVAALPVGMNTLD